MLGLSLSLYGILTYMYYELQPPARVRPVRRAVAVAPRPPRPMPIRGQTM